MKRIWRDSVLDALQRQSSVNHHGIITRQQLIADELDTIVAETQTTGDTPAQTLSFELQQLRDSGLLEFLGTGKYRLVNPIVDAENFEGTQAELDAAISQRRLRIGKIEANNEVALQKRRRGQQRIRFLALQNYGTMCALCDVRDVGLLVASHIVRWADSEDGRGDLTNVIVLCRPHDSLFELGYWSLDDNTNVLRNIEKAVSWVVHALIPHSISFRKPQSHEPAVAYLQAHRQRHGF